MSMYPLNGLVVARGVPIVSRLAYQRTQSVP
jgi:hypothetical protein